MILKKVVHDAVSNTLERIFYFQEVNHGNRTWTD